MSPRFSIIVPVYNVAPYLRECLDSVLAQTFTDWEAICVDDGSTDGSGAILDEYAAKDKRFRVIHQKNAGVSAARNVALDDARGEWIWFVDADDCLKNDALFAFEELKGKADVNFFNTTFHYNETLKRSFIVSSGGVIAGDDNIASFTRYLFKNESGCNLLGFTWNKLFRAEVIRKYCIRFVTGLSYSEDEVFTLAVVARAKTVCAFPSDCYVYRWRSSGLTGKANFDGGLMVSGLESVAKDSKSERLLEFLRLRVCLVRYGAFVRAGGWNNACLYVKSYKSVLPLATGILADWIRKMPECVVVVLLLLLRRLTRRVPSPKYYEAAKSLSL